MKTKVAILVFFSILLVSCVPTTPTQEDEVVEIATEEIPSEESVSLPITTEEPTETPTETPIACVTLLTPVNGAEIPPVGKATFSWTARDEAGKYVLNIILPSGDVVPFETDQTFHEQYIEVFSFGGEYQWQVVTQGKDGSVICISEVSKFNKPSYTPPNTGNNSHDSNNEDDGDNSNGGEDGGCGIDGCDGES